MNRFLSLGLAVVVLGMASLLSVARFSDTPAALPNAKNAFQIPVEAKNPFTSTEANIDPDMFQFAIVSDRTGGHRAGVFSRAVQQLNLLQPEFVMSVGDLIEGSLKAADNEMQWEEFNRYVKQLQMPFFYIPGNHDFGLPGKNEVWDKLYGRRYFHFTYKDCLFLGLNCFDTPPAKEGEPRSTQRFSPEQKKYIADALAANPKARWTFVFFHQPVWNQRDVNTTGWNDVEKMLEGRNYTVFVGHVHVYRKYIRQGMNYYQLATTGGGSAIRGVEYGEFDHVTWVTMKKNGPVIANLLLDGIQTEDLSPIQTEELSVYGKKSANLVTGKVVNKAGEPLTGIEVRFTRVDFKQKLDEQAPYGTGTIGEDGTYNIRFYKNVPGLPAGKYKITFRAPTRIIIDSSKEAPKPLPQIPPAYLYLDQSPLTVEVVPGDNNIDLRME